MKIVRWTRGVRSLFVGERERSISLVGERAYVEYRGVGREALPAFAEALAEQARAHEAVRSVQVNALTRRVVFRFSAKPLSRELLVELVSAGERAVQAGPPALRAPEERVLPDDLTLDHEFSIEALADALSLLSGIMLRIAPFVPRRLGTNLLGILFLIAEVEAVRKPLDERFGRERADFFLRLAMAFAQGVAQRPLSSLVELSEKVVSLRELRDRRALWHRWADQLTAQDDAVGLVGPAREREVDLPKGPIERHSDRTLAVALSSFGLSLVTTRSPARAFAAGFAALPQPARMGRELFAAELGRVFARHDMLVLSPRALRRLDRVDCLVVPAEIVAREQFIVGDVFALRDIARESAMARARRLFAPDRPLRVTRGGGYTLGPARLLPGPLPPELEAQVTEREARGALVLALSRPEGVSALVEVQIFPERGVSDAMAAARKQGLWIVLAADDVTAAEGLHRDDLIGQRPGLSEGIRRLQREGRTVCFVGRGPSEGYAAADVGVALCARGKPTPWGAHILCPDDTRALSIVVEAIAAARAVSEQSVRLAMGAAALGTLASTSGGASYAARRVMFVVNAASLVAMIGAVRRSASVEKSTQKPLDPTPWHALDVQGVLARLGTSEAGLPEPARLERRTGVRDRAAWGELGKAIQTELSNPLSPLLALGAGVSAMVGSMADASIVAGVGGINALVGGYQRFKTERAITRLVEAADTPVRVRRAGRIASCPTGELRRGDIVLLSQGDVVPADCRVVEAESLEVDTSALTGESMPVRKGAEPSFAENIADVSSMLHAGTTLAAGRAVAVVVAVGDETVARRAVLAVPDERRGGVEGRLRELMRMTGPVALSAGAGLIAVGMLRGRKVGELVSTGVGLAVAAVPEGLPVLATAAQLATASRLSQRGTLVKNPRAIEALGRVDVLCMDKTGTLTDGRITLWCVYDGEVEQTLPEIDGARRDALRVLACAVANSQGVSVDPMDAAIMRAAREVLGDFSAGLVRMGERAFESGRGFEVVLGRSSNGPVMMVKGAPEHLLARATHARLGDRVAPIGEVRARIEEQLERMAAGGLRVLAVAERTFTEDELEAASGEALLDDPGALTLRGLVAFRDPVRPTANAAVAGLARAGVRVLMITGDHARTAHAVAKEVGLSGAAAVTSGAQIAQMTEAELENAVKRTGVFARVTPAQKVRVVRALQRVGHVVGMVGDGANDAPAMRIADAGIAVGRYSTDAARSAADIVLSEPRVDALVDTIVEGRAMWTAVRDAVSILVGGNLGEIGFTVVVGGLTGRPPLSPRQLLLVNFLTDIAPSMAIALRPPSVADLMTLREARPDSALGAPLNREIVSRAITTGFGAGGAWLAARVTGGSARARTVGLVGLVGSQLGQTLLKANHSRSVVWTSLGSLTALGLIVQTPGLSQLFGCRPLGPIAWSMGLASSASATVLSPVVDLVVDRAADVLNIVQSKLEGATEAVAATVSGEEAEATVKVLSQAAAAAMRG